MTTPPTMQFVSSEPSLLTGGPAVEVTLISLDYPTDDVFKSRTVLIRRNTSVIVGRSSKNLSKNMVPAEDNLIIDSPVISRQHATLTCDCTLGPSPAIYLTDTGSMHGTRINGVLLPHDVPCRLNPLDKVQFGVDVVRDNGELLTFAHFENVY